MSEEKGIILPHGGYRGLIVYHKSEIIYQGTVVFCRRFLPAYGDRTVDQMIQAARSCKQNIVEGSAASGTSKETEIKLTNVAKATLDELLEDYLDYLVAHHFMEWAADSLEKNQARDFAKNNNEWCKWESLLSSCNDAVFCNYMIVVIYQTKWLLNRLLTRQESEFVKYGGVRERMYAVRNASRGQDLNKEIYSRLAMLNSISELWGMANEIKRNIDQVVASIAKKRGWEI